MKTKVCGTFSILISVYVECGTFLILWRHVLTMWFSEYRVSSPFHPFSLTVVCLFDLILYVPSTIFQLNRDGSSWVELVLS